ncbi:putative flippase GtrA [Herbihabitans rhizosphaerae]|uniref:Putative flippase GtrA n=1 Tax=Herbihabitans rhizosphaerae TaxID=1872711 RepID=A0A4Q7L7H1_9PSEU|nr:GtrA family protein [Herbihabitans rhizosphaerae]RZS44302.1 putative flippase GtrA [Herbihabitans rhizosphaerae]
MHDTTGERRPITDRFSDFCAAVIRRLPFGLSRIVPPSLLGFAIINGFTFSVDIGLLSLMKVGLGWPSGIAFTIGYVIAFGLAYYLNRTFNFHSHAPVGPQALLYAVAVLINYLAFILGVGAGLTSLGVHYLLARLLAGSCEAVYMYSVMRWVIFRDMLKQAEPHHEGATQGAEGGTRAVSGR